MRRGCHSGQRATARRQCKTRLAGLPFAPPWRSCGSTAPDDLGKCRTPGRGAPGAPPGSAVEAAGLLGCRQRLRDERLIATGTALVADAPDADAENVVARHDAGASAVHVIANSQGVVRIGRLLCAITPRAKRLMYLRSSTVRPRRTSRFLSCPRTVGRSLLLKRATRCDILRTMAIRVQNAALNKNRCKRGKSRGSQAVAQRCLTIAGKYGTSGWFGTARREPR